MDKVYLVSWARKLLGNRKRWNLKEALKLAITATYKQPDFRRTKGLRHFPRPQRPRGVISSNKVRPLAVRGYTQGQYTQYNECKSEMPRDDVSLVTLEECTHHTHACTHTGTTPTPFRVPFHSASPFESVSRILASTLGSLAAHTHICS